MCVEGISVSVSTGTVAGKAVCCLCNRRGSKHDEILDQCRHSSTKGSPSDSQHKNIAAVGRPVSENVGNKTWGCSLNL